MTEFVLGVLYIGLYLLPFIIGYVRKQPNKWAILVLNFFLGWTIIGWIIALVWAFKHDDTRERDPTIIVQVDSSQNKVVNLSQEGQGQEEVKAQRKDEPPEPNTLGR